MDGNRVIHLLLCSEDREFVQAFAYYVHTHSEWCRSLKVTSFATAEQLERYVGGKPLWDVCLCAPSFLPVMEKLGGQQECLVLANEKPDTQASNAAVAQSANLRTVYAYQPVPTLLAQVRQHAQSLASPGAVCRKQIGQLAGKGGMVAVFSAAGGTGKTTLALTLAKVWSRTRKVLYFNMEDTPSLPVFGKDDPLAEWLYIMRSREANGTEAGTSCAEEALTRAIARMHEIPCDWIKPLRHPEDYAALGGKELLQLRRMLQENLQYDFVIVDLPSAWHKHVHEILGISDTVICMVDGSTRCREKTAHLLERAPLQHGRRPEKAWVFVNGKAIDLHAADELDERLSFRLHAALPYVPAWKCNRGRLLQEQAVYMQAASRLAELVEARIGSQAAPGITIGENVGVPALSTRAGMVSV
ncbi:P-loop NTPase family protein [Xylanibacillus composti]|uniref:AAA family ATPase n=1 Tax=Xylanibacillus composti TaxID=1572762 RepID=A0A8J4M0X3_9BACL|nr:hypothetical protein [Xylanibacillus composti]GIQ68250.1 AAA family ATPase [Xylanibacillus composti]